MFWAKKEKYQNFSSEIFHLNFLYIAWAFFLNDYILFHQDQATSARVEKSEAEGEDRLGVDHHLGHLAAAHHVLTHVDRFLHVTWVVLVDQVETRGPVVETDKAVSFDVPTFFPNQLFLLKSAKSMFCRHSPQGMVTYSYRLI